MMNVYLLKETNVLVNGEVKFFVEVYKSEEKAKDMLEDRIEELKAVKDAELHLYVMDGSEAVLLDDEENEYRLIIEAKTVL